MQRLLGLARVRLDEAPSTRLYRRVLVHPFEEVQADPAEAKALRSKLHAAAQSRLPQKLTLPAGAPTGVLTDLLVQILHLPIELEQFLIQQGNPVLERLSETVTKDLEKILTGLQDAGISSEYVANRGAPERLIVELAKQKGVDLIVMGTHGRRGLTHMLLGSVAERVVRTAECGVLTVQEKKG
mgnify:CR=1 FL=1